MPQVRPEVTEGQHPLPAPSVSLRPLRTAALGVLTALALALRLYADARALLVDGVLVDWWGLIAVTTAVLFVLWLWASHRDVTLRGYNALEASHTALWCWGVPGFNGVQPALLVLEIWSGTGTPLGDHARAPWWIYTWWVCWLLRVPCVCFGVVGPGWERLVDLAVGLHFCSGALAVWLVAAVTLRTTRALSDARRVEQERPRVF